MQIDLIAVGKRMPDWVNSTCQEYRKRLPAHIKLNLLEVNSANRNKKNSTDNYKLEEENNILKKINADSYIILFDEHGKAFSSEAFAKNLNEWSESRSHITLIIGGPDGVSKNIKQKANEIWSLSKLTLPHPLARVVLIEQLYRAWTIIKNHPYHRE